MIGEYYGQNVDIAGMKNKLLKSYFLLSKIKFTYYYSNRNGKYKMTGVGSSTGNLNCHLKLHPDKTDPSVKNNQNL